MKRGPAAAGERRRCASLGRRHDNGIVSQSASNNRPHHVPLPRIGQSAGNTPDHYPGQQPD